MPKSLRKSALYSPASNRRALDKARSLPADMILSDLEDSVAPEVKAEARTVAAEAINKGGYGHRDVVLRISAPTTEFWKDGECHKLCVSGLAHAGFRYGHALKRSSNMIAN